MISAKGYSVNVNVPDDKLPAVARVIEILTSAEMQVEMATRLATTPVHKLALADSAVLSNELLQASTRQPRWQRLSPHLCHLKVQHVYELAVRCFGLMVALML